MPKVPLKVNSKVKANVEINLYLCWRPTLKKLVGAFRNQMRSGVFKFYFPLLRNPLRVSWVTGDIPAFGIANSWSLLTEVMSHQDVLQDDLRRTGSSKRKKIRTSKARRKSVLKDRQKLCRMALAAWLGGAFGMEIWALLTCSFCFIIYLNGLLIQSQL